MKIFKPGTEVIIKLLGKNDLRARIKSVRISEHEVVKYEANYWDGLNLKTEYFFEDEVRSGSVKHPIGFHDANK